MSATKVCIKHKLANFTVKCSKHFRLQNMKTYAFNIAQRNLHMKRQDGNISELRVEMADFTSTLSQFVTHT
jgi:hypothetical protein